MNGTTVTTLGTRAQPTDQVKVDGRALPTRRAPAYVIVNKPLGVVTTSRDPEGRPTVVEAVPRAFGRLFAVGRLDIRSTGLVLLTNDGELASALIHPRRAVPRTYRVKVSGTPDGRVLARLRGGIRLDDGPTGAVEVVVERRLPTKTWLRLTVREGRSHLVRRLCAALGLGVDKLERVALGPLRLGSLPRGAYRELVPREVAALRRTAGGASSRGPRPRRSASRRSV